MNIIISNPTYKHDKNYKDKFENDKKKWFILSHMMMAFNLEMAKCHILRQLLVSNCEKEKKIGINFYNVIYILSSTPPRVLLREMLVTLSF